MSGILSPFVDIELTCVSSLGKVSVVPVVVLYVVLGVVFSV